MKFGRAVWLGTGVVIGLATSAIVVPIAIAQTESNTFYACEKKGSLVSGSLTDEGPAECKDGETPIAWSKTGPQGASGLPGTDGVDGAPGEPGPAGADGADGISDGDGRGRFFSEARFVPDIAGCPEGEIRLLVTVIGAQTFFSDDATDCQSYDADRPQKWPILPKPEAPDSATLYRVDTPKALNDSTSEVGTVEPYLEGALYAQLFCSVDSDGLLGCEYYSRRYGPGEPGSFLVTPTEQQQLIDTGINTSVTLNQFNS